VTISELLSAAEALVADQWQKCQPPGDSKAYRLLKEAGFFLWRTGQLYRFEDYLARPSVDRAVDVRTSWRGETGEEASGAWQTLSRISDTLRSAEKKKLIQIARAQLEFIASTGQCEEFHDYLKTFYRNPPPVIARFDTRDEAETWLRNLPEPPSSAYILVGNEYLEVFYFRERGVRALRRDYALERFIEAVTSRGLPAPAASFDTHAEASAWWKSHPAPPLSVFVRIAGAHHLAVHHKKIDYRSLHSISILEDWRREQERIAEQEKARSR
jgi:hypothetical protein